MGNAKEDSLGENYSDVILDNFPAAVIVINAKGVIESINTQAEDMFGYDHGELLGQSINTLVPQDIREKHQSFLDQSDTKISRVVGLTREILGLTKSNEKFPIKIEISDFTQNGEKNFIGIIFDVLKWQKINTYAPASHYTLAEVSRQLLESETKYKTLFDKSDDPMWVITDGKFEICNESSVRILGYESAQELQSTCPSKLFPKFQADGQPSFEKAEEMMALAFEKGYHRFEWLHQRKSGEVFPVEVSLTLITLEGRENIFCVWRDISERKLVEEQMLRVRIEAEKSSQAKSDFLALMSHELRTPLNAILGFTELLTMKVSGPITDRQEDILKDIESGANILNQIVIDILQMTDIERGKIDLNIEDVKLDTLIDIAVRLVSPLAAEQNIEINIMKASDEMPCVRADKIRGEQIIMNLLSNAVKYNDAGGKVWVSVDQVNDEFIRVSVKDDGKGIDDKYSDSVFELFTRAGKEASGVEGTGIGLNIVKSLVDSMNGNCGFSSNEDRGVTFWFELPIAN